MSAAAGDAPSLFQIAVAAGGLIGAVIVAVMAYLRKGKQGPSNDVAVLSATFADRATVERLLHGMEALTRAIHDAGDRRHRDSADERETIDRNTAAIRDWTAKRAEMVNALGLGDPGNLPTEWVALLSQLSGMKKQ